MLIENFAGKILSLVIDEMYELGADRLVIAREDDAGKVVRLAIVAKDDEAAAIYELVKARDEEDQ